MEQNLRATKKAVEYSRNLCNRNLDYFSTTAAQKQVFDRKKVIKFYNSSSSSSASAICRLTFANL